MKLIATTGTILGMILLSGCSLAPNSPTAEPADEMTPSASQPETDSDNQDDEIMEEAPTGVRGELVALGWKCEDVSFNASVLDIAFNCALDEDIIALSRFNDQSRVADYAINVSATAHCKVHSTAESAFWATSGRWLLELDEPTDAVDRAITKLNFALEKTGC